MAHPAQQEFVESVRSQFPHLFQDVKVLEIGSLNINGSVRGLFTNCEYVGVDLEPGEGVDLVGEGQNLDFLNNYFDVCISAECFEHNPYWAETFANMARMASQLVVVTCATEGRPEHGTNRADPSSSPFTLTNWDYYKNLTEVDFRESMNIDEMFSQYQFSTNPQSYDLYFWGIPTLQ